MQSAAETLAPHCYMLRALALALPLAQALDHNACKRNTHTTTEEAHTHMRSDMSTHEDEHVLISHNEADSTGRGRQLTRKVAGNPLLDGHDGRSTTFPQLEHGLHHRR